MPLQFSIDRKKRRVLASGRGVITAPDVAQYLSDRSSADVLEYDQLIDVSQASPMVPIQEAGAMARDRGAALSGKAGGRVAVVATTDAVHEIAAAFAVRLGELGVPIAVFRARGDAERWLDTPAEDG